MIADHYAKRGLTARICTAAGVMLLAGVLVGSTSVASATAVQPGGCVLFVPAEVGVNDRFGSSIGVDGDDLAVGSWLADEQGLRDAGSVTTFALAPDGSQSQTQRLIAGVPEAGANFGFSVDLDGDILGVGAVAETVEANGVALPEAGAVYIFERAGADQPWSQTARLIAADADVEDSFGYSIEIDASTDAIVIGSHGDDVETDDGLVVDAGSAYLFERDEAGGWFQNAKLVDPAARPGDRAAHDVALSGPWVVVGHHLDDQVGSLTMNNAGGGLMFERTATGVTGPLELTGSAPAARDRAGIGIDVDGDLLAMTSWSQQPGDRSAVWVFRYDGTEWREEVRIEVDDPATALAAGDTNAVVSDTAVDSDTDAGGAGSQFGRHVEVSDGVIAVGASGDSSHTPGGGAVHYFGTNGGVWDRLARVTPDDVGENAQAGIAVGLSNRWAAIGAERAEVGARNSGGACVIQTAQLSGAADGSAIDSDQTVGVEVFVDAGERAPAPAVPLAAGPLQRFTGDDADRTLVLLAGAGAAFVAIAAGALLIRARGRVARRQS